jgi:hypothetical protein
MLFILRVCLYRNVFGLFVIEDIDKLVKRKEYYAILVNVTFDVFIVGYVVE